MDFLLFQGEFFLKNFPHTRSQRTILTKSKLLEASKPNFRNLSLAFFGPLNTFNEKL